MNKTRYNPLAAISLVMVLVHPALADEPAATSPPASPSETPLPEHLHAARQLIERGTTRYNELLYSDAAEEFRQAALYWSHPKIELYLGLALARDGQPVAAYESLQSAIGMGLDQLGSDDRKRADELRDTLLREQLAMMDIRCDEPGAQVSLDGEPLFVGPGVRTVPVRPASHVVTADKLGYFSVRQSITLLPGRRGSIAIEMGEDTVLMTRRWATWKPWAVVGAGVAVGLIGSGIFWQSVRDFDSAVSLADDECGVRPACPPNLPSPYGRAQVESRVGFGLGVIGAAVAVTGSLLVVLNRAKSTATEAPEAPDFDIVPLISSDGAGVLSTFRF